jgi:hypothetical protein
LDGVGVNWAVLGVGGKRKCVPVTLLRNLREKKRADGELPLGMYVDSLDKQWSFRKWIPALAVLLDLFIGRDPIKAVTGNGGDQLEYPHNEKNNK